MGTSDAEPSAPPKKGRGRWFKVRVILAALVLIIGVGLYLNWRNGLPPNVVEELPPGHAYFDVPLMAFYTPFLSVAGFSTSTNVTFVATPSYASRISFSWSDVHGTGLPVRFVMDPVSGGSSFGPSSGSASSGGFLFFPAGQTTSSPGSVGFGASNAGASGLFSELWRMDYRPRVMAVHDWLQDDRWIEVDYSITVVQGRVGSMPAANTTTPGPGDLAPVGEPLNFTYGPGFPWSYRWSVRNLPLPPGPFVHRVGVVSLDAGTFGTIAANLTSSFAWGPNDDYVIRASGSGPANLSLRAYVDVRFGSLLIAPLL